MLVKNVVIMDTCQGRDFAIRTMMEVVRNTAYEIDRLIKLIKDKKLTIKYTGPAATDWEPSTSFNTPLGHDGTTDYRQKLLASLRIIFI